MLLQNLNVLFNINEVFTDVLVTCTMCLVNLHIITDDVFALITDWHHLAIMVPERNSKQQTTFFYIKGLRKFI